MNINDVLELINNLNLPIRKTKSKEVFTVYLIKHIVNNNFEYYFGITNNLIRRVKEHGKTKTIVIYYNLFECNSKANAKILEAYLTLHYKLKSDFLITNKRVENLIF